VRDNGTGIPPEIRDQLFQPFFTTKPTGEGTGLGLSISGDIVTQQHGGTIEVDSQPGEFTEFTIRLPRHGQAMERSMTASSRLPRRRAPRNDIAALVIAIPARRALAGRSGGSNLVGDDGHMSVSISVVDDEPDVAEMFHQRLPPRSTQRRRT
jgi:Histidine kinase-, DNA gyrase B-, and HSP90-like ATPase